MSLQYFETNVFPLWAAVERGHLNIVNFLIKFGASVNQTTSYNATALYSACYTGRLEIARFLVEQGADIELSTNFGDTCLMAASSIHDTPAARDTVQFLIDNGAHLNRQNRQGVYKLNISIVRCLHRQSFCILMHVEYAII